VLLGQHWDNDSKPGRSHNKHHGKGCGATTSNGGVRFSLLIYSLRSQIFIIFNLFLLKNNKYLDTDKVLVIRKIGCFTLVGSQLIKLGSLPFHPASCSC
jgi:hypothetical protein